MVSGADRRLEPVQVVTVLKTPLAEMQTVTSKDIKSLTGVRFFDVLWIVLYHLRDELELISIVKPFKWLVDLGIWQFQCFSFSRIYFESHLLRPLRIAGAFFSLGPTRFCRQTHLCVPVELGWADSCGRNLP